MKGYIVGAFLGLGVFVLFMLGVGAFSIYIEEHFGIDHSVVEFSILIPVGIALLFMLISVLKSKG